MELGIQQHKRKQQVKTASYWLCALQRTVLLLSLRNADLLIDSTEVVEASEEPSAYHRDTQTWLILVAHCALRP
jgi:hypothetical protein